jgi:hypothetical protein
MPNYWCRWWPESWHFYYLRHKSWLKKLIHCMRFALIPLTIGYRRKKKCKLISKLGKWKVTWLICKLPTMSLDHFQFKFHYNHCSWLRSSCGAKYVHHYVTIKYHTDKNNPSTFWWKLISPLSSCNCKLHRHTAHLHFIVMACKFDTG